MGLRCLRIVRNRLTEAHPGLRTGGTDVQHWLKLRWIVQRGKTDGRESWRGFATREQRGPAIGAKAASREGAATGTDRERFRRTCDLDVRHLKNEAGSERSATGTLAVAAVTVEHCDWRARADITDRSARTTTGERRSHIAVSIHSGGLTISLELGSRPSLNAEV